MLCKSYTKLVNIIKNKINKIIKNKILKKESLLQWSTQRILKEI